MSVSCTMTLSRSACIRDISRQGICGMLRSKGRRPQCFVYQKLLFSCKSNCRVIKFSVNPECGFCTFKMQNNMVMVASAFRNFGRSVVPYISLFCAHKLLCGRLYNMKAWNCNAIMSKLEVVGNLWHRYDNSSPRYSVRTTMPSLVPSYEISYVSNLQEKHNASLNP